MAQWIQLRRALLWTALAVLFASIVTVVAIQIQQHVLRLRAERLLSDLTVLKLRESDWRAAQELMLWWGRWGRYEGTCTPEHCYYQIELEDFAYRHIALFGNRPWAVHLFQRLGGRPARIRANWEVERGLVWGKGLGVSIEVPPGPTHEFGYSLMGTSDSVSRFSSWRPRADLSLHPNYIIGTPGGCELCLAVYAKFTPYADPADVQRLMQFNLACLTRWHPCLERNDIMPTAWNQYLTEMPLWQERRQSVLACNGYPLEWLGRDSENAALAEIVSATQNLESGEPSLVLAVKLLKRLKSADKWPIGTLQELRLYQAALYDHDLKYVVPGRQLVLLLHDWSRWRKPEFEIEFCGAIPATQTNFDAIQRGINLDYRAGMPNAEVH